jgi:TetR/AcrR family transcriptional repressor of mexJK operon
LHFALFLIKFNPVEIPLDQISGSEPDGCSPARRARILAGAAEIFIAEGYEGASMSQIAESAKVSKGTLYNYFPSKQALFSAFVRQRCSHVMQDIFGELQNDSPVEPELRRIGMMMLKLMIAPAGQSTFRVVVMEAAKFPELAQTFMECGPQAMVARMMAWLTVQNDAGKLHMADPEFAAEQFFALTQTSLVLRSRVEPSYRASEAEIHKVLSGAIRVFLAAYGPPLKQVN